MSAAFAIGRERLPSPRSRKLMRQPLTAIRVFRPPSRTRGTARVHRANRIRIECIRPPSGSDSDGNRIGKTIVGSASATTTTGYLIDPQNPTGYTKAIDERTTIGATTTTRSYVLGNKVEAQSDATNGVLYLLTDGHGSTRALTSTSGAVIERYDYDAFGTTLASGTSSANAKTTWLFGGDGIYDPASGWTYHLARWRDGFRFTSYDSFEADPSSPADLHKYLYADANPVAYTDPSGRAVYYVTRKLGMTGGGLAWYAGGVHGYLLITSPSDPGSVDPFKAGQPVVATFSWHPYKWNYTEDYGRDPVAPGVPGRVWEQHTTDINPGAAGPYETYLISTSNAAQTGLLSHIDNWIQSWHVGYDYGAPTKDPSNPQNDIGNRHVDAPEDGVYYSLLEQNCVWWATLMLVQSGLMTPATAPTAIAQYNAGMGGGPAIVAGTRSANEVHTVPVWYARLPVIDAYIDATAWSAAYFGIL